MRPVRIHRWARRARVTNPLPARRQEAVQLEADLPEVYNLLNLYGVPIEIPDMTRSSLTALQLYLAKVTAMSDQVAQDEFLQQFRKHLHLLLDH